MVEKTETKNKTDVEKEVDEQIKQKVDLTAYIEDFNKAYDYVNTNYHGVWEKYLKAYKGIRTNINYNGYSDAFVPETHTIIESLQANIAGGNQKFEYYPTTEEQEQDTKILTERAEYVMACNKGGVMLQNAIKDCLRFGNAFIHGGWNSEKKIPKLEIVPIWNFFVDPTSTCLEDAGYAGHRYLTYLEDMKREMVTDVKTGEQVPKYKNLDSIKPTITPENGQGGETDKEIREKIMLGSTLGVNEKQVEIIRIYYQKEDKLVEIANRSTIVFEATGVLSVEERTVTRTVEMPDAMGNVIPEQIEVKLPEINSFLPYAHFRDYMEPSLFYGTGEIEIILPRQETLNDVENQDLDNMSYVNNTMYTVDPQYADMIPEIENQPGAIYALPKGALSVIEKGQISQDVDYKKREIKDEMRRATAADEVIQGANVETGGATATEITSVVSSANTRFSSKIKVFESEGFAQLAMLIYKLDQVFLTQEERVRVKTDEGMEYKEYDPALYAGEYEPHVLLETSIQKLDMEKASKMQTLSNLFLGNPIVNQKEAVRLIAKEYKVKPEDIEKLLTLEQPQMMPGNGPVVGPNGLPMTPLDPMTGMPEGAVAPSGNMG